MRIFIHVSIILLVLFSISVETYMFLNTSMPLPDYPTDKLCRAGYYYSYFTVLSNITLAVSSFLLLLRPKRNGTGFNVLRLDGLICIIITSVVYNLILRGNHPPEGIMILTNELLHVVVPFLGILGWLVYGPRSGINLKIIILAIIPPFLYVVYIFIRGKLTGLYPYPFMDLGRISFTQALINVGLIMVIFIGFEFLLLLIDQKLSKNTSSR